MLDTVMIQSGPLLEFGNWLQNRQFALDIVGSSWAYPYVQALHFSGLSLFVGTNLALDFNLLGLWKGRETASELCSGLILWNWIGFVIGIVGGFLLFAASAATYVINPAFRMKLVILIPVGLILHIVVQRKVLYEWSKMPEMPKIARLVGLIELLCWLSVATAAVLIPYMD
ncbi:MAG: DUF6644 family protein [Candidatus Acidiferrales bacterium]|jgi:hypothetical protein